MMHTMEAILSSVLILIGVSLIFPMQQKAETSFSEDGYACLKYLDQEGLLRYYVLNSMNTELESSLKSCLPPVSDFKFKICNTADCRDVTVPYTKTVYLSSYLISGENTYNRKIINLWVWSK